MAIKGIHAMFYSSDPEGTRAFLRDKVQLPHSDVGEGWLIFDVAEGDIGVHPIDHEGAPPSGTHDVSFYCEDLEGTMAGMKERGVEFDDEVSDQGYARVVHFTMPGQVKCELYEPRYKKGAS